MFFVVLLVINLVMTLSLEILSLGVSGTPVLGFAIPLADIIMKMENH